jgi:hypothetical protein
VSVVGLTFFATTLMMWESPSSAVTDCKFLYPSYSRRALGEVGRSGKSTGLTARPLNDPVILPQFADTPNGFQGSGVALDSGVAGTWFGTKWTGNVGRGDGCNLTLARNTFWRTDGMAVYLRSCGGALIEDNSFKEISYSGVSGSSEIGVLALNTSPVCTVRRNFFGTSGPSETIVLGRAGTLVELNYFTDCGHCQEDGYAVHAYVDGQNYAMVRQNWVIDSILGGIRFDAALAGNFGENGTVLRNVAYGTSHEWSSGLAIKGLNHTVRHNTAMESGQSAGGVTDIQLSRCYPGCDTAMAAGLLPWAYYNNNNSVLENNAAAMISSATTTHQKIDFGKSVQNNFDLVWHNEDAAAVTPPQPMQSMYSVYRDPPSGDFRPRIGSPLIDAAATFDNTTLSPPVDGDGAAFHGTAADIGAYEYNSSIYWIPGPQTAAASMPVPFDTAAAVMPDADLMFLQARDAVAHDVRLWSPADGGTVATATAHRLHSPSNIHCMLGSLKAGQFYQWRVDAVRSDGSMVVGQVWSFTTFGALTLQVPPTDDAYTHVYDKDSNFGTEERLQVKKTGGTKSHRTSFLRFDFGLHSDTLRFGLLANASELLVKSVVLRLRLLDDPMDDVTLWAVDTTSDAAGWNWNESGLTFNTAPALGDTINTLTGNPQLEAEQFVEFNLTANWSSSEVVALLAGGGSAITFALTTSTTTPGYGMGFYSKETSDVYSRPSLQIELEALPPPPTTAPTKAPTTAPTKAPTKAPTDVPSAAPTDVPSAAPTEVPSAAPIDAPTDAPTGTPTDTPSAAPTDVPSAAPTSAPSNAPTSVCNRTMYFASVQADCAVAKQQCFSDLSTSVDDARFQYLCGDSSSCAQYFDCVRVHMTETGCEHDEALAAGLQAIQSGCAVAGGLSGSSREKCKEELGGVCVAG